MNFWRPRIQFLSQEYIDGQFLWNQKVKLQQNSDPKEHNTHNSNINHTCRTNICPTVITSTCQTSTLYTQSQEFVLDDINSNNNYTEIMMNLHNKSNHRPSHSKYLSTFWLKQTKIECFILCVDNDDYGYFNFHSALLFSVFVNEQEVESTLSKYTHHSHEHDTYKHQFAGWWWWWW
jgi:hypothetical protein